MALDKDSLATRIESELSNTFGVAVNDYMIKYAKAMATAIIAEIKSNGVVTMNYMDSQTTVSGSISITSDVQRTAQGSIT